jgi:hypothetical protein
MESPSRQFNPFFFHQYQAMAATEKRGLPLATCRDACVSFEETVKMLEALEDAVLRRRGVLGSP